MSKSYAIGCCALVLSLLAGAASAARDPTQPPPALQAAPGQAQQQALQLQAILRGSAGTYAVINGQRLQVGAELADARLLAIYPHAVLLERQGRQELLRLVEPILKPSR